MSGTEGPQIIIFVVVLILLCCIGTVLNVLLLVIFVRHPETRTADSMLLINHCIGDICYLLSFVFLVPLFFKDMNLMCFIIVFYRSFATALNIYSVAVISIQRYIGLSRLRNRFLVGQDDYRSSRRLVVGVWILSAVMATVDLIEKYQQFSECKEIYFAGISLYRLLVHCIVPSVIITVFCIAAACKMRRSARKISRIECNSTLETLRNRRTRSARILFALAIVFVITYVPIFVAMYLLNNTIDGDSWTAPILLVSILISTLNPIFDPIALCVASRQLRKLYMKNCCSWCLKDPVSSRRSTSAVNTYTITRESHL